MQIVEYIKDVRAEMIHVKWPTRKTTLYFSLVVVAVSVVSAMYLGLFDLGLSELVKSIVS